MKPTFTEKTSRRVSPIMGADPRDTRTCILHVRQLEMIRQAMARMTPSNADYEEFDLLYGMIVDTAQCGTHDELNDFTA